jgi:hypothetical protein
MDAARAMGASVHSTHSEGFGFPDFVAGFRGRNVLFEVKQEGERLTDREQKFHDSWRGTIHIVYSGQDVVDVLSEIEEG